MQLIIAVVMTASLGLMGRLVMRGVDVDVSKSEGEFEVVWVFSEEDKMKRMPFIVMLSSFWIRSSD